MNTRQPVQCACCQVIESTENLNPLTWQILLMDEEESQFLIFNSVFIH